MPRQLIHSSEILENRIDTHDGKEIIANYFQLCQLIAAESPGDRAQLLAEPLKNADHNRINWYTSLSGEVKPYESLTPEEQSSVWAIVEEREAELKALANKVLAASVSKRKFTAELLTRILSHPEYHYIYLVGDQPVVAGWGLTPLDGVKRRAAPVEPMEPAEPIAQLTEKSVPPAPLAIEITTFSGEYSLWKLFLGLFLGFNLLAIIFFILFPGFKIFFDQFVNPPRLDTATFDRNNEEEDTLRQELEKLRGAYIAKLAACPLPEPAPVTPNPPPLVDSPKLPDPPKTSPEPESKDAPEPQPEPKPQPEPTPQPEQSPPEPQPEPKPNQELEIPEGAEEKNDLSFMEGCWESRSTGLLSRATDLPIAIKYCFNAKGNAVVTIDETDSRKRYYQTCSTTAAASFRQGALVVSQSKGPVCPKDRTQYSPSTMVCVPSSKNGGTATCVIKQPNSESISATFKRLDSGSAKPKTPSGKSSTPPLGLSRKKS
ncbi:MAG: SrfA family protein [Deltaproteobacteria bacterium]|jgi:hypothetical protein|nr:SrfA family protein [Deltaproteobacteria bacterium]